MWLERMQDTGLHDRGCHPDSNLSKIVAEPVHQSLTTNGEAGSDISGQSGFGKISMISQRPKANALDQGPKDGGGEARTKKPVVRDLMSEELNSDDDMPEEDTTAASESNVLLCQFNKVGRDKTKTWTMNLINGVLQLDSQAEVAFREIKGKADCKLNPPN